MDQKIPDFYPGTSVSFKAYVTYNDAAVDIRSDTVTLVLSKHDDPVPVLSEAADVTTRGAEGIALFTLLPEDTELDPGPYEAEIVWTRPGGSEYILRHQGVTVLRRSSP